MFNIIRPNISNRFCTYWKLGWWWTQ